MTARQWLRVVAAFLLMCGAVCLPSPGGGPKRFTSLFSWFAYSGSALHLGLSLTAIGIALVVASYIGHRGE